MKMKKKKIEKGISRIQFKHNNEIQAMELRIENHKNQLLREKANKMHEIDLKYKNKERKQKAEKELFVFYIILIMIMRIGKQNPKEIN